MMRWQSFEGRHELMLHALEIAREAAELVSAGWRKCPRADKKGAVDLVTDFDRRSEELIRERLLGATPYPVIGEEQGGERPEGDGKAAWYVDPIDGTTNFVHGHPFFCVSIGLLVGDTPILGVVVAPALATEWTGIVGDGDHKGVAMRNGEPCGVSTVSHFNDALLATGFPYDRSTSTDNNFDAFVAIKKQCQAVRRCGSAEIDLCLVADGTYDGYWEMKLKPWDFAAGAAIVMAAGGRVSAFDGGPLAVADGHVIATNSVIHGVLIQALRGRGPSSRPA